LLSETTRISRTGSFVPTVDIQKTSAFSTIITERQASPSDDDSGTATPTAEAARAIVVTVRRSTLGHIFSCALLIIVGMSFWVYSAYMERTLTNMKWSLSTDD
jgi:hypothetical protein